MKKVYILGKVAIIVTLQLLINTSLTDGYEDSEYNETEDYNEYIDSDDQTSQSLSQKDKIGINEESSNETPKFDISVPWVQHALAKDCQEDIKCMEIKAELIALEKIKTDLDLPNCGNDTICQHYRSEMETKYKAREYCSVTHPIAYHDRKRCCTIQNWYEDGGKYIFDSIECKHGDASNGCCNDVEVHNCTEESCYDNPIRFLNEYLEKSLKDSNPLCSLLTKKCSDEQIRSTCPKTCSSTKGYGKTLQIDNSLCGFAGKNSCHIPEFQKACPLTCTSEENANQGMTLDNECTDKQEWCAKYPNCAADVVKQICPKACNVCTVQGN